MRKTLLLVMLFSTGVLAESTVYIGDQVKIPMRSNDAIAKDNVISHLNINTPVTLIKKQANGWSNIKHDDKQGWIISRYLTNEKPTNKLAEQLQSKLDSIKESSKNNSQLESKLNQQIKARDSEISRLNVEILNNNTQSLEFNKLEAKLLNLDEVNTDLIQQVSLLKAANSGLHTTDFLTIISAITLLLGFAVGMGMSRASTGRDNQMYKL
ncbi:TIGR04211 family SH3 domain-containing protein [Candidatus Thioglobus sp.]|nr:TIGR04211 family SH3 domain-containing protein [Candidatus Thioglobus sp.]